MIFLKSEIKVASFLLDAHVVTYSTNALDTLRQLDCSGDVVGGLNEATKLNNTFEGFNVDLCRADRGIVENGGFHSSGYSCLLYTSDAADE